MSFDFRQINRASNDPLLQFISEMQKQLAKKQTTDQVGQLDDSEDIYSDSQDVETKVSWDSLLHTHTFRFDKSYYAPIDPGRMVVSWLRGYNMGSELRDFSQYERKATIHGEPVLVDGTFDIGTFDESVGVKSVALKFNRPTSPELNAESLQLPDHGDLHTDSIIAGEGFSEFFRFRPHAVADQGSQAMTLWEKTDNSTPTYGRMMQVRSDGRLVYIVVHNGTVTAKQTNTGVINPEVIYGIFATFTVTGNIEHIYTWIEPNVGTTPPVVTDQTLTNFVGAVNWHATTSNHDLNVFRRGVGSTGGYVYGDFYDYEFYRPRTFNGIVTSTQVGYRSINKLSISNIPFGQVITANHWATLTPAAIASFTSTSFTGTSFTT